MYEKCVLMFKITPSPYEILRIISNNPAQKRALFCSVDTANIFYRDSMLIGIHCVFISGGQYGGTKCHWRWCGERWKWATHLNDRRIMITARTEMCEEVPSHSEQVLTLFAETLLFFPSHCTQQLGRHQRHALGHLRKIEDTTPFIWCHSFVSTIIIILIYHRCVV